MSYAKVTPFLFQYRVENWVELKYFLLQIMFGNDNRMRLEIFLFTLSRQFLIRLLTMDQLNIFLNYWILTVAYWKNVKTLRGLFTVEFIQHVEMSKRWSPQPFFFVFLLVIDIN